ncbi:MAG: ABC transporter permease [Xanthobacteraceae bacterium]
MALVATLASRNLLQDRLRFVATLIGIVFSVVLVMVQMGLYLGFGRMVTTMIDHAPADLWVVSRGTKSFEDLSLLDTQTANRVRAVAGVADVIPVVIGFSAWRLPGGGMTPIFVVGSNIAAGGIAPWNVTAGSVQALSTAGRVAVDKTYFGRLGVTGIGAKTEIRGLPAEVAAVTDGIRSFTTTPYVFAALDSARSYIGLPADRASHFLVRLKPGAKVEQVRSDIQSALPHVEALTPAQFSARSRSFWLFSTGAGAALFAGALLGVIVGTVIVAQTLYSSTKDHLYEFATLRAIGCTKSYIYTVIILQALISAVLGFVIAAGMGFAIVAATAKTSLPIVITPDLLAALFLLTVAMCVGSALAAISRVVRLEPVMVMAR